MRSASFCPAARVREREGCVLGVGVGACGWEMQGCERHYIIVHWTNRYHSSHWTLSVFPLQYPFLTRTSLYSYLSIYPLTTSPQTPRATPCPFSSLPVTFQCPSSASPSTIILFLYLPQSPPQSLCSPSQHHWHRSCQGRMVLPWILKTRRNPPPRFLCPPPIAPKA